MTIDTSILSSVVFSRPAPPSDTVIGDRAALIDLWPELAPWRSALTSLKAPCKALFLGNIRPTSLTFAQATSTHPTVTHLLNNYTGDGLHIFGDADRLTLFPTGTGALFFHPQSGSLSIATHLRTLVSSACARPSANIQYALYHLAGMPRSFSHTAFDGYFQVPPGHALTLSANGTFELVDVSPNFTSDQAAGIDEFIPAFKSVLRSEIEHLAAIDGCLTLSLSGGHDSTLLALIVREVRKADIPLRAINCFDSRFSEGDERAVAQATADHIGAELTCLDLAQHRPFSSLHLSCPANDFTAKTLLESYYRKVDEITPGSYVLNGMGGDSLFLEFPSDFALLSSLSSPRTFIHLCKAVAPRQNRLASVVAARAICGWMRARILPTASKAHKNFAQILKRDALQIIKKAGESAKASRMPVSFRRQAERLYLREAFSFLDILATGNSAFRVAAFSPYLSTASLRVLMSIPVHAHLGTEKRVVQKEVLRSLGYDPSRLRASKGFITSSIHAGISEYHKSLRELCSGVLSDYLDEAALSKLWRAQLAGSIDATPVLGKLIEVEIFYRSYLR